MRKRVSLKDVAQAVGVSTALVSYVLNGKEKEARVGKEIAEKIRETAKQLNYQPNQIAKSLKSGKSQTIGLIVADISNPFFANLARTIEDEAKKDNYTVIFGSSDENAEKSWDLINVLIKRQVDGFIIAPTENSEKQIQNLESQNIPLVLIDRYFPEIDTNYVVTDNYQASYDAVTHLIKNGKKRIGMIANKNNLFHMRERKRGYLEALRDHNLLSDPNLIKEVNFTSLEKDIASHIHELLDAQPAIDGLFFETNTLTLSGLKFINEMGFKVPDDIAIVCFDGNEAFDFFYSPLTYVQQPLLEVGREAVRILIDQIGNAGGAKRQVSISSKLIRRRSSEAV